MAQVTGWTPDRIEQLRPGEFHSYLELALRLRGINPEDTIEGAPPPTDDTDPGIASATLLHLPEDVLLMYPPAVFAHLSPSELQQLPGAVRAKLGR